MYETGTRNKCEKNINRKGVNIEYNALLMDKQSKICLDCYKNQKKKISKCPSKDVLKNLISDYSNVAIAKMYNVSEAAVRKWINNYNLVR